ncbi:Holliday junction ATP-dependent DNA helicase RuvA [Erysipelotrichaceae bacterium MTC7]|nr:Holliday junction ATP-dependent DNA helicase RuvA [Erysipelotrichaceae bacterium MTC7]
MIAFIRGNVWSYTSDYAIVDCHGVGYKIFMPNPTTLNLKEEVLIYTYEHIREDAHILFGFTSTEEQELFERLISVKGIGPKIAIGALAAGGIATIVEAIESGNMAYLKSLPGIGNKAASQIVLDLKGKLVEVDENVNDSDALLDAIDALKSLGYKPKEVNMIVKELRKSKATTVDAYIKEALGIMAKQKGV